IVDSGLRAMQSSVQTLVGQQSSPLTPPPIEGPQDLDTAISDLMNRTARIARFTPLEIEYAPKAWHELRNAARRSVACLDWKDTKSLLLPVQIPLSIGTLCTALALRGLSTFEIIGLERYPRFFANAFEMFTEVQIYVSVQYPAVVKRYQERLQEA